MALIFVPDAGRAVRQGRRDADQRDHARASPAAKTATLDEIRGCTGLYVARPAPSPCATRRKIVLARRGVAGRRGSSPIAAWQRRRVLPRRRAGQAVLQVHARGNLSVDEQRRLVREVEERILDLQRETGEISRLRPQRSPRQATAATRPRTSSAPSSSNSPTGTCGAPADEILDRHPRAHAPTSPASSSRRASRRPARRSASRSRFELTRASPDAARAGRRSRSRDASRPMIGGLVDVEDSRPLPGIEWEMQGRPRPGRQVRRRRHADRQRVQLVTNGIKSASTGPTTATTRSTSACAYPTPTATLDSSTDSASRPPAGLVPISNFVTRSAQAEGRH